MQAMLFSATADPEASQRFYRQILGLKLLADTPFALVFDVEGTTLRVQKVEHVVPVPYTVLGFEVDDLTTTVIQLAERGVSFQQYSFLEQNEQGIWTTGDGAQIAWCQDPDGNTISFSAHS
jgi:catechol 2,3-dioxygenase-like lactoylglutathione lyase family enzyme